MTLPNIDELIEKLPTGYTPGPWALADCTVYALDETGNCNRFSTRVDGGWSWRSAGTLGGDRTTDGELHANAALIALAPEMAAALSTLQEQKRKLEEALRAVVRYDLEAPEYGLSDCIDNDGEHYKSAGLAALLMHIRALLSGGGE